MAQRKALILGASSLVGRHFLGRIGGEPIATYNTRPIVGGVHFDAVRMGLRDIVPDPDALSVAMLLLGDTNPDACAGDPVRSQAVNVDAIKSIVDRLAEWRVPVVFTSSEFVFDGQAGNYRESDVAKPILVYGRQKLEIEQYIERRVRDYAIVRLPKIYGVVVNDGTLFSNWIRQIKAGGEIRCAHNQRFSPLFIDDAVTALTTFATTPLRGLFHVAGLTGASRLELLELLLASIRRFRSVDTRVTPCSIDDFKVLERRPHDVTMCSDAFVAATGARPRTVADVIASMVERVFASPIGESDLAGSKAYGSA